MAMWQAADLAPFPTNHERQMPQRICNPRPDRPRPITHPTRHMSLPFTPATTRPGSPSQRAEEFPNDQLKLPFRGRFRVEFRGFFEHSSIIVSHHNSISCKVLLVM